MIASFIKTWNFLFFQIFGCNSTIKLLKTKTFQEARNAHDFSRLDTCVSNYVSTYFGMVSQIYLHLMKIPWYNSCIKLIPSLRRYEPGRKAQEEELVCRYNQNKGYVVFSAMGKWKQTVSWVMKYLRNFFLSHLFFKVLSSFQC